MDDMKEPCQPTKIHSYGVLPGPKVWLIAAPYYAQCTYFETWELHDHVTITLDEWEFWKACYWVFSLRIGSYFHIPLPLVEQIACS